MSELQYKNISRPPQDGDYLWKYVDIHKFLDLLLNRRFRFTRMDQFEDSLEGIPFESLWKISSIEKESGIKYIDIINSPITIIDTNSSRLPGRLDGIFKIQTTTYVSCWFYENRESMAMWNLYSNSDGVAIGVRFDKIKEMLIPKIDKEKVQELYCGYVDYQDISTESPESTTALKKISKAALRKDMSFAHEKEFRFVIRLKDKEDKLFGIDSQMIDFKELEMTIICHPKMPEWKRKNIKSLLKNRKIISCFKNSVINLR